MKEYWEITYDRGVKSLAVWYMDSSFKLKNLTMAQHQTRIASLETLAQTRTALEQALATAREQRADFFAKLHNLNIRVAQTIDGAITDDSDLHGLLDLIYAVGSETSQDAVLRRARHVEGLWTKWNAELAAEVPPESPLSLDYAVPGSGEEPEPVLVADFTALLADALAAQTNEAAKQREVTDAKSALRAAERKADRDNKRWYQAWTAKYPEGTQEGDAARSQVPTEQGVASPKAIQIASATVESGNVVFIEFVAGGGAHATTKELLYRLQGEPDYGHSTPITGAVMHVGPFAGGQTVTFVTRVSNSNSGNVLSTPFAVGIPA